MNTTQCTLKETINGNGCVYNNAPSPIARNYFFKNLSSIGFLKAIKKYDRLFWFTSFYSKLIAKLQRRVNK